MYTQPAVHSNALLASRITSISVLTLLQLVLVKFMEELISVSSVLLYKHVHQISRSLNSLLRSDNDREEYKCTLLINSVVYGPRSFNTRVHQLFLSLAESTQFLELTLISLRFILILSIHLCLGFPKGLFSVGSPVIILKAHLLSSILAR